MSSESFADLGVSRPVLGALAERGIKEPFAVQRLCIADVLAGEDVLVQSPTGSGKTFAFGIPIVERIQADARRPAALVLAPTRELAEQIVDELRSIAHSRALKIAPVFGGVGIPAQAKKAAQAHIVVATPGRLEDLLDRGAFNLQQISILVLDEADRMLDMGFKPAVDRIVKRMPTDRQTLFFSATLEGAAGKLAAAYTHDAKRHVHAPKVEKAATTHRFLHLRHDAKVDALVKELRDERGRTLVFVRTKRGADRLVKKLGREQVRAVAMHGNKSQSQRRRALADFELGKCDTLVATDVASRGIDVDEITHVINFDAPEDRDTYVHRTGRTGRAGASGLAASFVLPDQHHEMRKIATDLGLHREFSEGPGFEHAARQHSSNGSASGKSFKGSGRGKGSGHNSGNGGPRTYSARPPRNRRRRNRSRAKAA
ncbi:MAG TPA: DEAD/DEAH box helicase [Solirubrobacterales bacterium]|nr:DEAD/DEAH box helicase [Solirubrobacterales bacterium]